MVVGKSRSTIHLLSLLKATSKFWPPFFIWNSPFE
jgi:hypothetical protein